MLELCAADNTEDLGPCFSHHPQRTNEQWSPGNIDIVLSVGEKEPSVPQTRKTASLYVF